MKILPFLLVLFGTVVVLEAMIAPGMHILQACAGGALMGIGTAELIHARRG